MGLGNALRSCRDSSTLTPTVSTYSFDSSTIRTDHRVPSSSLVLQLRNMEGHRRVPRDGVSLGIHLLDGPPTIAVSLNSWWLRQRMPRRYFILRSGRKWGSTTRHESRQITYLIPVKDSSEITESLNSQIHLN